MAIPRTPLERALQIAGNVWILALVAFAAWSWPRLPEIVPVHFGASGLPDGWGSRATLIALPVVAVVLHLALGALERFPHVYNYPVAVTPENARRIHRLGRQLVLASKLVVTAALGVAFYGAVLTALGHANGLGAWYLPAVLVSTGGVVAAGIVRMARVRHVQS